MIPGLTGKKRKDHLKKKDKRKWIKQYAKTFFSLFQETVLNSPGISTVDVW